MGSKTVQWCDICKQEGDVKKQAIQVIFTTEQTEGRSVDPYLTHPHIDICAGCLKKAVAGGVLFAHGAQGHNTYYFKGPA